MTALLEESVGRKDMFNDFMDKGDVMREDCEGQPHKKSEVLAVSSRGDEPREFKNKKLDELFVLIIMY